MDLASPKLAETADLSEAASEKLFYDSIMKLTIHVLKDPLAGFKQVRYTERHLFIGKNTSVRVFMDRLDILSTYLPLFPPMKGELLQELSDSQKATILYDALPNYYIKNMKEANTEPIEMNLKELFQFALNIEEASINPGKDAEGNPRNSKETKMETNIPRKQGGKVKITKRIGIEIQFLRVKKYQHVIFVDEKDTQRLHAKLKIKQWPLQRKTQRTEVLSGKRIRLKEPKPLLQLLHQLKKRIVLVMMKKRKTS
jgi:hypothetical protein